MLGAEKLEGGVGRKPSGRKSGFLTKEKKHLNDHQKKLVNLID